ncbi:uncharacterized protein ACRADG_008621 [Cochliomyia hominivorax]
MHNKSKVYRENRNNDLNKNIKTVTKEKKEAAFDLTKGLRSSHMTKPAPYLLNKFKKKPLLDTSLKTVPSTTNKILRISETKYYKKTDVQSKGKKVITTNYQLNRESTLSLNKNIVHYKNINIASDDYICCKDRRGITQSATFSYDKNNYFSKKILENLRKFLRNKHESLVLEDVELIEDIIKINRRYNHCNTNSEIIKNMFKSKLYNIMTHEKDGILENLSTEVINEVIGISGSDKKNKKLGIEVKFKNVQSVHRKIDILKELYGILGDATSPYILTNCKAVEMLRTLPSDPKVIYNDYRYILKIRYEYFILTEYIVEQSVNPIGIRQHFGTIREFSIAQESLIELKLESSRKFYIPSNSEGIHWIETSFKKLKNNPNELFRHIKSKKFYVMFNVLEQDPIFFRDFFNKTLNLREISSYDIHKEKTFSLKLLCDGVDNNNCNKLNSEANIEISSTGKVFNKAYRFDNLTEPVIRRKHRRRIRRYLTPISMNCCYNSKNSLYKSIFVGFIQIFVFIIFIMALTYPNFKC